MEIKPDLENWGDKILAECIGEELPPCQAACPLDIRVREKLRFMQEGRMAEALEVVLERCPFPGILGRICVHPCETACTRAKVEAPIAIAALKRYVADLAPEALPQAVPGPDRHPRVAVVGGGPAGLMAAYELRKIGYPVTLFEAENALGGALRLYIPSYRLPREMLDREVSLVERLGTEIRLNTRLGRDLRLEDLRRDYAAVFLGVGAHQGLGLNIPGADLPGVVDALSFLKAFNSGQPLEMGKKVAVIGGGNVALDAARSAVRAGAWEVYLLYRRSRAEMPALAAEVEEAHLEGIHFFYLTMPVAVLGEGRVQAIRLQKTELGEADPSGRRCPLPVAGSEFDLEVDMVIPAVGQTGDFSFLGTATGLPPDSATIYRLEVDPRTLETRIPGVFAGGDIVSGPRTAVEAFAAGRRAALAIDCHLQGKPLPDELPPLRSRDTGLIVDLTQATPSPRQPMPGLCFHERRESPAAEVELGFTAAEARGEAQRCLQCVCSQCVKNCTFLQAYVETYPYTEKEIVRILAARGETEPLIPFSCHYCGLCQTVCPRDLHAGEACLDFRRRLVSAGKGPLPQHKGIQNYVKFGTSPTFTLSLPDPATGRAERVFFPGCSLPGYSPHLVRAAYQYLREKLPGTGIILNCCGAPRDLLGEVEGFNQVSLNVLSEFNKLGARELILACPDCMHAFARHRPEIKIRSLYEVLLEVGPPPGARAAPGRVFHLHDGCGARHMPHVHDAVRRLVEALGYGQEDMEHARDQSICCGAGGMVPAVDRPLAQKMTAFRLSEATRPLISYCATCRAVLAAAGRESLHLLDLVFNPGWQTAQTAPPAGSLKRWWSRWRLKRHLQKL